MSDDDDTIGQGQRDGWLRPDWGEGWANLKCDRCDATWVGPIGETCAWCVTSFERMRTWQAQMLLMPPDVDDADTRRDGLMEGWHDRMAVAIAAGLITREQGRRAWNRTHKEMTRTGLTPNSTPSSKR